MMTMTAGGAAASMISQGDALAAGKTLQWKAFPAGEHGFFRAPVLVWGATEAVLVDGGFTLPDGRALVEAIKGTGRKMTARYPDAGMGVALQVGAKVATGERKWG